MADPTTLIREKAQQHIVDQRCDEVLAERGGDLPAENRKNVSLLGLHLCDHGVDGALAQQYVGVAENKQ
jgi:hypothetical protein